MRTFTIGDIHGCSTALNTLVTAVPFRAEDTLVALGDYVDRGPDSRGVIETLLGLCGRVNLITLRGNHEIMMLAARHDRAALLEWCHNGGEDTLRSYEAKTLEDIPVEHWGFIANSRNYHETDDFFFVHANACPDFPLADQPDYMLFWEHLNNPAPHESGRIMICGHSPQRNGRPLDLGHTICIDTYAHGGGWLTCLDVNSRIYWQADQAGVVRTGSLP